MCNDVSQDLQRQVDGWFSILSTVRGRSHEVLLLVQTMVNAQSLEQFDRAYNKLGSLLEAIGDRLDLVPMEVLGYTQTGPDTWHRK